MDKKLVVALAVVVALIILAGLAAAVWLAVSLVWIPYHRSANMPPPAVPGEPPTDTAVVFNFQPHGDADAKLYAMGFPRALSDRLVCAPKSLVQQPSSQDFTDHMYSVRAKPGQPIPDGLARDLAVRMGVRYAIVGDLDLHGDQVAVTLRVLDASSESSKPVATMSRSGRLSDLPQMQVSLAGSFLKAIKLSKAADQARPNFSNPKTLTLYARSCLVDSAKEAEELRWQAWENERESLFPALRLLEFYAYGPASCGEILRTPRLNEVIATARMRHADNTFLDLSLGLLLTKQYRYREAQDILEGAVARDPGMARAHDLLAYVAWCRGDAGLAMKEAEQNVSIWPNRAVSHLRMSDAHRLAAGNASRGRYFGRISGGAKDTWGGHTRQALQEARVAVAIDPDCYSAWHSMHVLARELGDDKIMETAFKELVRINPKSVGAYETYAFSFSPQWGGSRGRQEDVFRQAEQVFGVDSPEMCLLKGWVMLANSDRAQNRPEILRLLDVAISKSKDPWVKDRATHLKSTVLMGMKRHAEMLEVAKKAFDENPNLEWRMQVAKGYQFRWQDAGDRAALDKAAELLRVYVDEIPFDPYSRVQYGWCLSHQGRPDLAKKQFEFALKIDPQNELAKEKMKYVQ